MNGLRLRRKDSPAAPDKAEESDEKADGAASKRRSRSEAAAADRSR